MGRWSWATIRGRQNRKIIIITVYKVCNQPIEQAGPTTAISQQWQIAQRENRGNENMADSTIIDLQLFINSRRNNSSEIIICVDANKTANHTNSNILKLCRTCKLCDPIAMKHGTESEPNTYSRGSGTIDFIFCTNALLPFISFIRILPFGFIVLSDHRGQFMDINIQKFLRNSNSDLVTNHHRTLISSHSMRPIHIFHYS